MAIKFKTNGVVTANVPIKWKFLGHSTVWLSLPANFENNVVVKAHYLGLHKNYKVEILNGEVSGSTVKIHNSQPERCSTVPTSEKITDVEDEPTGFTTTLCPDNTVELSDDLSASQYSVPETTTTTKRPDTPKRKVNR